MFIQQCKSISRVNTIQFSNCHKINLVQNLKAETSQCIQQKVQNLITNAALWLQTSHYNMYTGMFPLRTQILVISSCMPLCCCICARCASGLFAWHNSYHCKFKLMAVHSHFFYKLHQFRTYIEPIYSQHSGHHIICHQEMKHTL